MTLLPDCELHLSEIFGNVYAIWYVYHPLTSTENFADIVPGKPLRRGLTERGVAKYSDFGPIEGYISEFRKRCKIGGKLVLITNRKSYMSLRLVPKSVTLNDLERRNLLLFVQ